MGAAGMDLGAGRHWQKGGTVPIDKKRIEHKITVSAESTVQRQAYSVFLRVAAQHEQAALMLSI